MNIKQEIKVFETFAIEDVATAKTMKYLGNGFLLSCINLVRQIIIEENPHVSPTSDIRYRSYVVKVLSEAKRQELPDWEEFFIRVLTGKNNIK